MLPPEALAEELKAQVLKIGGNPAQFGAPAPDIFAAGISQSQAFLPCVAEGRIVPKPWITRIDGRTVHFADGSGRAADTFHPELPGLALLGLYDLVGPYLPVLELQARWIAQAFAGTASAEAPLARTATLPMHAQAPPSATSPRPT